MSLTQCVHKNQQFFGPVGEYLTAQTILSAVKVGIFEHLWNISAKSSDIQLLMG